MIGRNVKDVRESNGAILFELLRKRELSLTDMQHLTKLSRPTVTSIINSFINEGLVIQSGVAKSQGGRSPALFGINSDAYYAIGIDYDFPYSRIAISDLKGTIIKRSKQKYKRGITPAEATNLLIHQIEDTIAPLALSEEKFIGIGMGMPGLIDYKRKRSIVFERIDTWSDYDIGTILEDHFDIPVYMRNDVHMLVRAERKLWDAADFTNLLYMSIRSGIGMAVVIDGEVLEGELGNLGFIGHTIVNPEGPVCSCGKRGCLELYNSEPSILRNFKERTGEKLKSLTPLIDRAKQANPDALAVLERAGYYLGIGVVNASLIFDVPNVVINAWFDHSIMIRKAQEVVDENLNRFRTNNKVQILPSQISEDDYALGGCLLAIDQEISHLVFDTLNREG